MVTSKRILYPLFLNVINGVALYKTVINNSVDHSGLQNLQFGTCKFGIFSLNVLIHKLLFWKVWIYPDHLPCLSQHFPDREKSINSLVRGQSSNKVYTRCRPGLNICPVFVILLRQDSHSPAGSICLHGQLICYITLVFASWMAGWEPETQGAELPSAALCVCVCVCVCASEDWKGVNIEFKMYAQRRLHTSSLSIQDAKTQDGWHRVHTCGR